MRTWRTTALDCETEASLLKTGDMLKLHVVTRHAGKRKRAAIHMLTPDQAIELASEILLLVADMGVPE